MVESVILAEFDNNRGAEITYEYPYSHGMYCLSRDVACYMIPEHLHKTFQDASVFIVRETKRSCPVIFDPLATE